MAKPFKVYLVSALRKIWRYSAARAACIKQAKKGADIITCAACHKDLPYNLHIFKGKRKFKLWAVDHIDPIGSPPSEYKGWDTYIERMLTGKLQILCNECHQVKTNKENEARRASKGKAHKSKTKKGHRV